MIKPDCQDMHSCDTICDGEALAQRNAAALLRVEFYQRQSDEKAARWMAMVEGQIATLQQIVDELRNR